MMVQMLAMLGALTTGLTLDSGTLTLRTPSGMTVAKHSLNWETNEYTIRRKADGVQLLMIIVGGGAMDLKLYRPSCINGKRAWRLDYSNGANFIVGDPGVNAVFLSYRNLSPPDSGVAYAMVKSVKFRGGSPCR